MNYQARIEVNQRVKEEFAPELKALKQERTSCEVKQTGEKTIFEVKAKDATGLKIAVNSITKMLEVIEKMEKV